MNTSEDRASFLLAELCDAVDRLLGLAMHDRAVALLETPSTRRLGSPPLRAKTPSVRAVLAGEKRDEPSPDRTAAWTGAWLALVQRTETTPRIDLWEQIDCTFALVWGGVAECHGLAEATAKRLLEEFASQLSVASGTQHWTPVVIPEYGDWDELWVPHLWLSMLLSLRQVVPTLAQASARWRLRTWGVSRTGPTRRPSRNSSARPSARCTVSCRTTTLGWAAHVAPPRWARKAGAGWPTLPH